MRKKMGMGIVLGACAAAMAVFLALAVPATAETGVSDKEIVLGMSSALSGPAASLGTDLRRGAMAYFEKINASGGVNGRRIRLIAYDDGYEPRDTVENTKKLIETDKVFALFGYVGTPTAKAVLPMINASKIIFFGPFTGAEFLRTPVNRYIFNVRSSYFDEAEAQVAYLTEKRGVKRIGMFIQDDAYGLAVKGGIMKSLNARGMSLTGEGRFKRNTTDVDEGLAELRKENPEAISMVGTYSAMAAFIKKARAMGFAPVFLNVSFVGTNSLITDLAGKGDGTIVSQVMPSPSDASIPVVAQYQKDMRAAGEKTFGYGSLEGYVDALVFTEVLKAAGPSLTRDSFIAAAEGLSLVRDGFQFRYSPRDHQAMDKVFLTVIEGGRAVPIK